MPRSSSAPRLGQDRTDPGPIGPDPARPVRTWTDLVRPYTDLDRSGQTLYGPVWTCTWSCILKPLWQTLYRPIQTRTGPYRVWPDQCRVWPDQYRSVHVRIGSGLIGPGSVRFGPDLETPEPRGIYTTFILQRIEFRYLKTDSNYLK